jgi:uncharacterized membrane-anchored protein
MVVPKDEKASYWIAVEFQESGYVKDDESIDADKILGSIKEAQEEGNKERQEKGFPPLNIDGWSEAPHYDKATHRLIWALEVHSDRGKSVNFNTRMLGRKGFVSLNLITSPDTLASDKPAVQSLLQHTEFGTGAKYADFDSKTDKVATYGLIGLIAGGAGAIALKSGIIAKLALLLVKFGKVILVAIVAGFGAIKRFFTGKPKQTQTTTPPQMVNQTGKAPGTEEEGPPTDAPSHPPSDDFK